MVRILAFLILLLGFSDFSQAQESTYFGNITNQLTGEPISGVHVFVPNTSYQTYADSTGQFILPKIPMGSWKMKVFAQGYEPEERDVTLGKPQESMEFELTPKTTFAPIRQKLSDKKIEKNTKLFVKSFLGSVNVPSNILLVNPEALTFEEVSKEIKVSAQEAVYFQNLETGYLVTTYFEPFFIGEESAKATTDYVYFELEQNSIQDREAIKQKQLALFENSLEYKMIQLLSGETTSFSPDPAPKVFYGDSPGEYKLTFQQPLQATLENGEKVKLSYLGEHVLVKSNGALVRPEDLTIEGEIESHSPVFYLPSNFEGDKVLRLKNLEKTASGMQERIFLHTDRGYYWPNETIVFKAYVRYGNVAFVDQLSKVLHVELLDENENLMMHRVFRIENGLAQGYLSMGEENRFEKGNHVLRAYTSWSTNYGRDGLFQKPLQILDWDDFPVESPLQNESLGISFFSDKESYGPNETVVLNILAQNAEGKPIDANLSIAVLDLNQTQVFEDPVSMTGALELMEVNREVTSFENPIEFGYSLKGLLFSSDSTILNGNIEALMNGFEDRRSLKTNETRSFMIDNNRYEGEFEVAIKAQVQTGAFVKKKTLELKRYAENVTVPSFAYGKTELAENKFLTEEDIRRGMQGGEILMEEAVIEAVREPRRRAMPYGAPNNIVDPSELQLNGDTQQFLFLLSSRVPGMRIGGTPLAVSFRAGGEPLVMINGVPAALAGTPVIDILSSINVFTIESIEVVRGTVNTLGDQGRNGVISIFTKTGEDFQKALEANINTFQSFSFDGFPTPESIQNQLEKLNSSDQSQRPVLYWNPNLTTTQNNLSQRIAFKTGNQPGPMWVEIRGITELGEPLFGRFLINGN